MAKMQALKHCKTMKIYLAGPDVFRQDALAWADEARRLCALAGHGALIPLDGVETTPSGIYHANIELIRSADAVLANLNPFRGCEPDSGTCVEVGFALALGKLVIGYLASDETTTERVARLSGGKLECHGGRPVDRDGMFVEDFRLRLNLMLAVPVPLVIGGLPEALLALGRI
jgi:nucleoside 2-deoxyribosyltransferase